MKDFDPGPFAEAQIAEIKKIIGNEKAIIALSGGVDSSTCAVLTHLAIGNNLLCVILDDAFMREGEPERVAESLSQPPMNLPIRIERVQEKFLQALTGLRDAEEKRKAFRETFYRTLGDIAKRERSSYMIQGTILADVIETRRGIKTQHNVLEQIGISAGQVYGFRVVEPLDTLLKWQVREVARYLGLPRSISERQPFPGPGLSVRVVGEIRPDKLASLKDATTITEGMLAKYEPSQYFAVIIDNEKDQTQTGVEYIRENVAKFFAIDLEGVTVRVFKDKATGMKENVRTYGKIAALRCQIEDKIYEPALRHLTTLQKIIIDKNPSVTRVWYMISKKRREPYSIAIRAVKTEDFLTAKVSEIPWPTLNRTAERILEKCANVSEVYYDVTPKPPSTVEME